MQGVPALLRQRTQMFHLHKNNRFFNVQKAWQMLDFALHSPEGRRVHWLPVNEFSERAMAAADIDREYAEKEMDPSVLRFPGLAFQDGEDAVVLDGWHRIWHWRSRDEMAYPIFLLSLSEVARIEMSPEEALVLMSGTRNDPETRRHLVRNVARRAGLPVEELSPYINAILDDAAPMESVIPLALRHGMDPMKLLTIMIDA